MAKKIETRNTARTEWYKVISSRPFTRAASARAIKHHEWLPGKRCWPWRCFKGKRARAGQGYSVCVSSEPGVDPSFFWLTRKEHRVN